MCSYCGVVCPECGAERSVVKTEHPTTTIHVQSNPGVDERALVGRVRRSVMRAIIGSLDLAERNRPPRIPPGAR